LLAISLLVSLLGPGIHLRTGRIVASLWWIAALLRVLTVWLLLLVAVVLFLLRGIVVVRVVVLVLWYVGRLRRGETGAIVAVGGRGVRLPTEFVHFGFVLMISTVEERKFERFATR